MGDLHRASGRHGNRLHSSMELEVISELLSQAAESRVQLDLALKPYGLSWAGYETLSLLVRFEAMPFDSIARRLRRHRTTVTATVARTEQSGLTIRYVRPGNAQQYLIEATEKGHRVHKRAESTLNKSQNLGLAAVDPLSILTVLKQLRSKTL